MSLRLLPAGHRIASHDASPRAGTSPNYGNNNPLKLRGNDNLSFGFESDDETEDESLARRRELNNSFLQESNSPPLVLNEMEQSQLKKFLSKFVKDVTSETGIEVYILEKYSLLPTIMRMDRNLSELRFDVYTEGISSFTDSGGISPRGVFIDSFVVLLREIREIILDETLAELCPELVNRDIVKNSFEIWGNEERKIIIVCNSESEKRQYVSAIALFRIASRGGDEGGGGRSGYFGDINQSLGQDDGCSSASCRVQANIRKVLAQQEEEQRLEKLHSHGWKGSEILREDPKAFSWRSNEDNSSENNSRFKSRQHTERHGEGSWTARDSTKDSSGRKMNLDESGFIDYHSYNAMNNSSQYNRSSRVKSINSMRNANRTSFRQMSSTGVPTTPTFHALSNKPQGTGLGLKGPTDDLTTPNLSRINSPFRPVSCCNDPCRGCNKDQATIHPVDIVPLPSPGFTLPIMPDSDQGEATPLVQSMDADYFHRAVSGVDQHERFEQTVMFGRSVPSTSTRYLSSPLHYPPSASSASSPKTLIGELMRSSFDREITSEADTQKIFPNSEGRKTVIPVYGGDQELSYYNYNPAATSVPGFLPPVSPFNRNAPFNFHYDINGYVRVRGGRRRDPRFNMIPAIQEQPEEDEEIEDDVIRATRLNDEESTNLDESQYEGVYTDETVDGEIVQPQVLPAMALIRNRQLSSSYSESSDTTELSDSVGTTPEEVDDQLTPLVSPLMKEYSQQVGDSPADITPSATRLQSVESVRAEKLAPLVEPATPYKMTQNLGLTQEDFSQKNRAEKRPVDRSFSEFFHQEDMTNTTWEPHVTNDENTLTLMNGEDQASNSCLKDLHRQQAIKMLQNDDNFSISPSELAGLETEVNVKTLHQRQEHRKQEIVGRTSILGPGVHPDSSLMENKPWQQNRDSMSPLEKLRKASKYGTPTPFAQIQYKRLEEEGSVANMSSIWTRHER